MLGEDIFSFMTNLSQPIQHLFPTYDPDVEPIDTTGVTSTQPSHDLQLKSTSNNTEDHSSTKHAQPVKHTIQDQCVQHTTQDQPVQQILISTTTTRRVTKSITRQQAVEKSVLYPIATRMTTRLQTTAQQE